MLSQSLHSTLLPLPLQLLNNDSVCCQKIPLANLSQLSQLHHLPVSCPSCNFLTGVATDWEKEKVLMLCNHWLAIVISTVLVRNPKQPNRGFCEENQQLVDYPGVHSAVCIALHPVYISNHAEPNSRENRSTQDFLML